MMREWPLSNAHLVKALKETPYPQLNKGTKRSGSNLNVADDGTLL